VIGQALQPDSQKRQAGKPDLRKDGLRAGSVGRLLRASRGCAMPLRLSNLRLRLDEPEISLLDHVARRLGVGRPEIRSWRILRKSCDTRDKAALRFVYTVEASLTEDEARIAQRSRSDHHGTRIEVYREPPFALPPPGSRPLAHRPIVIGSGPAGLAAAYF